MTAKQKKGTKAKPVEAQIMPPLGLVTGTDIPRTRESVAIVGFAPGSMTQVRAFFDDPGWEIWGLNQLYITFPMMAEKATRWFQIHRRESYDRNVDRDHSHHGWMQAQRNFPIYMETKQPDIPTSVDFPWEPLIASFGSYFTNSISWMIALAIFEGFKKIALYGIDMAQDCVAPETRVLTSDLRWVPAGEIKVGEIVMGFDENPVEPFTYRQWRGTVVEEANRLVRPCYRLHMADGTKIVCSAGHKWLAYSGELLKWKRTDDIAASMHRHKIQIVRATDVWEEDHSWGGGYLAAAFDGEGHIVQSQCRNHNGIHTHIGFSQRKNGMSKKVDALLGSKGYEWTCHEFVDCDTIRYYMNGGKTEMMRFLGQFRPPRLLEKFDPNKLGAFRRKGTVEVVKAEFIGDQEVVGFKTSTKTFISEGLANHNSEYEYERPSVEYFLGIAKGAGIELIIPAESDLLKTMWIYPLENSNPFRERIEGRMRELRGRVNQHAFAEQENHDARLQLLGALDNMQYIKRAWENSARELAVQERMITEALKKK